MTGIVNIDAAIKKMRKLPVSQQEQVANLIEYLYFKEFSPYYEDFLEEEVGLIEEDRQELRNRIIEYEKDPDSALPLSEVKTKWEERLELKL